MKKMLFCLSIPFILAGCSAKNNEDNNTIKVSGDTGDSTNTAVTFFPVTAYLMGQLTILDSMPVTFLQIITVNRRSDSSWLTKEKLKPALKPFFEDDIDKHNLTSFFKESKFKDESTEAITFTYEPLGKNLPDSIRLRHWDVYVHPETGLLKRVYIVKQINDNGINITRQLTWVAAKNARMVDIENRPDGTSEIRSETRWIWNFDDN